MKLVIILKIFHCKLSTLQVDLQVSWEVCRVFMLIRSGVGGGGVGGGNWFVEVVWWICKSVGFFCCVDWLFGLSGNDALIWWGPGHNRSFHFFSLFFSFWFFQFAQKCFQFSLAKTQQCWATMPGRPLPNKKRCLRIHGNYANSTPLCKVHVTSTTGNISIWKYDRYISINIGSAFKFAHQWPTQH